MGQVTRSVQLLIPSPVPSPMGRMKSLSKVCLCLSLCSHGPFATPGPDAAAAPCADP